MSPIVILVMSGIGVGMIALIIGMVLRHAVHTLEESTARVTEQAIHLRAEAKRLAEQAAGYAPQASAPQSQSQSQGALLPTSPPKAFTCPKCASHSVAETEPVSIDGHPLPGVVMVHIRPLSDMSGRVITLTCLECGERWPEVVS